MKGAMCELDIECDCEYLYYNYRRNSPITPSLTKIQIYCNNVQHFEQRLLANYNFIVACKESNHGVALILEGNVQVCS